MEEGVTASCGVEVCVFCAPSGPLHLGEGGQLFLPCHSSIVYAATLTWLR